MSLLTLCHSNYEVHQIVPFKQTVNLHAPKNSMCYLRLHILYKYEARYTLYASSCAERNQYSSSTVITSPRVLRPKGPLLLYYLNTLSFHQSYTIHL